MLQVIAVGTPPGEDGSADLQYVVAAARATSVELHDRLQGGGRQDPPCRSAPPTACQGGAWPRPSSSRARWRSTYPTPWCPIPEFLKEGAAVEDFMRPDRIIVGSRRRARHPAAACCFTQPFQRNHDTLLIVMDVRSAELTKYAANAMLATRISFMNELAQPGRDCWVPISNWCARASGSDPRIGYHFLYAWTAATAARAFPKDVQALIDAPPSENGRDTGGAAARWSDANATRRSRCLLSQGGPAHFGADLAGKRISRYGDSRSSPIPTICARRPALTRDRSANFWRAAPPSPPMTRSPPTEARRTLGDEPRIAYAEHAGWRRC